MFEDLAEVVDGVAIPTDAASCRELVAIADRLALKARIAVGALDAVRGYEVDGHVHLGAWLGHECGVEPRQAERDARAARKLHALPGLVAAAADGTLTSGQVDAVIAGVGRHRNAFTAAGAELLDSLHGLSVRDTVVVLAEWAAQQDNLDPLPPTDIEPSTLSTATYLDGRGAGRFDLDRDDNQVVRAALEAAGSGDRELPLAERRGAALVTLARTFLAHQRCTRPGRSPVHVHVVVTPDELAAGAGGQFADGTPVDDLGVLACDAVLHRLVIDESGTILAHGRSERLFTDDQRRLIAVRDGRCRFPDCDRPVSWTDAHHVHWWEHGGCTDIDNGVALCRRHHRLVHRDIGFHLKLLPDGTLEVTYPGGHTRTTTPALARQVCEPRRRRRPRAGELFGTARSSP